MKKIFNYSILLLTIVLLSGCGIDNTKSLVVFEKNIGISNDILGTYKPILPAGKFDNNTKSALSIIKEKNKYYLKFAIQGKNQATYFEGEFIPSKVDTIDNYYIMSFPTFTMVYYDLKKKTKNISTTKNALLYFKNEENMLMFWTALLSNKNESNQVKIKDEIIKTFSITLVKNPLFSFKKDNKFSIESNKLIKNMKLKYNGYTN